MTGLLQALCLWLFLGAGPRPTTVPAALPHLGVAPGTRWEDRPVEAVEASPSTPHAASQRPATRPASPARSSRTIRTQQVSFTAEDGPAIVADYLAPPSRAAQPAPMVILVHMYGSDRSSWQPLLPALRGEGFAVVAIDLRGHGESTRPTELSLAERVARQEAALFKQMHRDVAAAYLWLRARPGVDPTRLAIVAAGESCGLALEYASRDSSVDAVICLTPTPSHHGMDPIAELKAYGKRPLLLLTGEADRSAADSLKQAAGQATLKVVPSRPEQARAPLQGTDMLGWVAGVESTIADFCARAVGSPATDPVVASLKGETYYAPDSNHVRNISPENLRWFSSPAEAESRGLRPPAMRFAPRRR